MSRRTDAARRRATLVSLLAERGGVARRAGLVAEGCPQRTISEAVQDGVLQSLRRVWVALPSADPFLIASARAGVVISCVTRARRLGLWVAGDDDSQHVAAHPKAGRIAVAEVTRVHRAAPMVLRHPEHLEDAIENTLANVCACQPFESALVIVESALRMGLTDRKSLLRLPMRPGSRAVIEAATPFSDSGLETYVVPRLRWMRLRIVPQVWIAGRPVDFLIGERLVLQIDGGHHVGRQRASDNRHDAVLMQMGYHVVRVGYIEMMDDWPGVQALIMGAVARGLHLAA